MNMCQKRKKRWKKSHGLGVESNATVKHNDAEASLLT